MQYFILNSLYTGMFFSLGLPLSTFPQVFEEVDNDFNPAHTLIDRSLVMDRGS